MAAEHRPSPHLVKADGLVSAIAGGGGSDCRGEVARAGSGLVGRSRHRAPLLVLLVGSPYWTVYPNSGGLRHLALRSTRPQARPVGRSIAPSGLSLRGLNTLVRGSASVPRASRRSGRGAGVPLSTALGGPLSARLPVPVIGAPRGAVASSTGWGIRWSDGISLRASDRLDGNQRQGRGAGTTRPWRVGAASPSRSASRQ